VLGYGELPALHASVIPLRARDMLIFATDGISRHFSDGLASVASAQSLADDIMRTTARETMTRWWWWHVRAKRRIVMKRDTSDT